MSTGAPRRRKTTGVAPKEARAAVAVTIYIPIDTLIWFLEHSRRSVSIAQFFAECVDAVRSFSGLAPSMRRLLEEDRRVGGYTPLEYFAHAAYQRAREIERRRPGFDRQGVAVPTMRAQEHPLHPEAEERLARLRHRRDGTAAEGETEGGRARPAQNLSVSRDRWEWIEEQAAAAGVAATRYAAQLVESLRFYGGGIVGVRETLEADREAHGYTPIEYVTHFFWRRYEKVARYRPGFDRTGNRRAP